MRIQIYSLILLAALNAPLTAQEDLCFEAPHDRLCPAFPHDVPEFSAFFEYMVISDAAQAPFDRHAWQAFVALNWNEISEDPSGSTWRAFPRRDDVLSRQTAPLCGAQLAEAEVVITDLTQSDGHPLVDINGNYILYETRLNDVVADYIRQENLQSVSGQHGKDIEFPRGRDANKPASVLIKTAWTMLDVPSTNFITADGLIVVPAEQSLDQKPMCIRTPLGLIGMHIVTKVESGNGDEWVWSTFEHRANAPTAEDARDINAIYGRGLFPRGCIAPETVAGEYLLYNTRQGGTANTPPPESTLWSENKPFAVDASGEPLPASQVVRCWKIFGPTKETNSRWQSALRGTPLEQYMLISAQWRGANISPYLEHGELPRFLSNVTMETYLQTDREGTCLGCHAGAETAIGTPSDFTFVLRRAQE